LGKQALEANIAFLQALRDLHDHLCHAILLLPDHFQPLEEVAGDERQVSIRPL
jgi:hypothetical protein